MSELQWQFIAFFKIVFLAVFCLLYGLGGMLKKEIRRIAGTIFLTCGIIGFSLLEKTYSPFYWLYLPCLFAALSIGYGGQLWEEKVRRRLIYGAGLGASAIVFPIINRMWVLFGCHFSLCVIGSVVIGVTNPTRNAREEETIFGVFAGFLPLFMV